MKWWLHFMSGIDIRQSESVSDVQLRRVCTPFIVHQQQPRYALTATLPVLFNHQLRHRLVFVGSCFGPHRGHLRTYCDASCLSGVLLQS